MIFKRKNSSPPSRQSSKSKVTLCLGCLKAHSIIPKNELCTQCNGRVFTFDSMMESNRYVYLKNCSTISYLTVQKSFSKGLPVAEYCEGHISGHEPIMTGYSKKISERTGYKMDFCYYDCTTRMGWVAEEFKPCPEAMDSENKRKINDAYDQHYKWGHFCYSYPERNAEHVEGKCRWRAYERMFVDRAGASVRYRTYDEMFNT